MATSGVINGSSTIAGLTSPDVWSTAERIALQMVGAQVPLAVAPVRATVAERMTGRLGFVGSNARPGP